MGVSSDVKLAVNALDFSVDPCILAILPAGLCACGDHGGEGCVDPHLEAILANRTGQAPRHVKTVQGKYAAPERIDKA